MKIRRAVADDWEDLRSAVEIYAAEQISEFDALDGTAPILGLLMSNLEHVWIMRDGADDFCGYCAWIPSPDGKTLFGVGTWVSPDLRKYGHSAELRDAARAYWKELGFERVRGTCAKGNEAGMRSILAMGFETVGFEVEMRL
jgi:RimJ/RimL family protein N-acetyltransferase